MRQMGMEFLTAIDFFRGVVSRGKGKHMCEILEQITDGNMTLTRVDGAGKTIVYANGVPIAVVDDIGECVLWLRTRKTRGFTHTHTQKIFIVIESGSAMWQNGKLTTSTAHKCVGDWLRENN